MDGLSNKQDQIHWKHKQTPLDSLIPTCGRNWLKITLYTRKLFVGPRKVIWCGMNSNGPGWHKSFAHIKHHASAAGQDGLALSSLLNISFRLRGFQSSLHQSIHKTYLNMSVNRSPNGYDFRGGAKTIHYSVNIALQY